jgi:hypothetical protein
MCLDFCFPGPPLVTLDKLDIEAVKRGLKKARVDNYQMFCKDHNGNACYATKIGKKHPGLKIDYVKDMREFLREEDIKFTAYYSVGFDDHVIQTHPDWAVRDENGRMVPGGGGGAHFDPPWVCTNTPYRQYVLGQLEEIIRGYEPDGLMLDIMAPHICYCSYCQDSFRKKYGRSIPKRENQEQYWRELLELRDRIVLLSFMQDVNSLVRRLRPEMVIYINGGPIRFPRKVLNLTSFDFAEHHAEEGLWDACWRGLDPNNMPMVAVSPDPYDPYPTTSIIVSGVLSAAQNTMPNFGSFTFKPDGTLNQLEFENVGKAFEEIERIEPYLRDRESVKSLGVLYSESTRLYDDHDVIGQGGYHTRIPFIKGLEGALELCNYSKYPFDAISEEKVLEGELSQYEALMLSNVACMSEEVAEKISDYVREGGLVMASHRTSLKDGEGYELPNFRLAQLFGCDFLRINERYASNTWGSYLHRKEHPVWKKVRKADFPTRASFIETGLTSGQVLATHVLPMAVGTGSRAATLHPSEITDYPAIQVNSYGKGKVVYFSFDYFWIDHPEGGRRNRSLHLKWPKPFFRALLRQLLPSPKISTNLPSPSALTVSYFRGKGRDLLIIHQVNDSVVKLGGDVLPVSGGTIVINGAYFRPVRAHVSHPEEVELRIEKTGDDYRIATPNVDIHSVIVVEGK